MLPLTQPRTQQMSYYSCIRGPTFFLICQFEPVLLLTSLLSFSPSRGLYLDQAYSSAHAPKQNNTSRGKESLAYISSTCNGSPFLVHLTNHLRKNLYKGKLAGIKSTLSFHIILRKLYSVNIFVENIKIIEI